MAIRLSNLVNRQLPEFISTQYSTFATFLEKYYEGLEVHGQPLDILSNITSYYDINYYQKNLLERGSTLTQSVNLTDTVFEVEDATGFPDEYGYFKVGSEICFYTKKEGNSLTGVYRGVSGTTKLGDLYKKSKYEASNPENHSAGDTVQNISNLFLFAIVKSFESQYLGSIPKNLLSDDVDKRTLIKNITSFYKAKGSEKSIKFIFNSLVDSDPANTAEIKKPSEQTMKLSTSDWTNNYEIYVKIISGNPNNLISQQLVQTEPSYASAFIDVVEIADSSQSLYKLTVDKQLLNSEFDIFSYTELVNPINVTDTTNFVVEVVSTKGWKTTDNYFYINNEEFLILNRNINQFTVARRSGTGSYPAGTKLYISKPLEINGVKLQVTGSVYNISPKSKVPYSSVGDPILEFNSAVSSRETTVFDVADGEYRWIPNINRQKPSAVTASASVQANLANINTNVSAIFEDETYFYICSSGYPSFDILGPTSPSGLEDNKYLKLIRKNPVSNTDVYEVGRNDVAIFLDGTIAYSKISENFVNYGRIEKVNILSKGSGYKVPPIVLVNNSPNKARAVLSGDVVSDIEVITEQTYRRTPHVEITSGRKGELQALVTSGRITDIIVTNPGEYYTSPPTILITDRSGRGRFAEYRTRISSTGKIIGVDKINEGRNYTADNVVVNVIPAGSGASVTFEIKKWYKNRYTESTNLDGNHGTVINKKFVIDKTLGKSYAILANPKKLRLALGDNINSLYQETVTGHSKIIGYAYDGNPIYGPYGYTDPLDSSSAITRLRSGYTQNSSRLDGPPVSIYPLGTFDEDFTWSPNINTGKTYLDINNGRYCVTPEYPQGVYAYFLSIDASGNPVYPYIIGKNYYSIPVDSNYNSPITQDQVPRTAKILDFTDVIKNGQNFSAVVSSVNSGFVNGFFVDSTVREHNPGNKVFIEDPKSGGSGLLASVGTVSNSGVDYIRAKESVCKLRSLTECYLFKNYIFRQQNTGFEGNIVGDVFFDSTIILEDVTGNFTDDKFDLIDPNTNTTVKIISLLLNDSATFTANSTIQLTDGKLNPNSVKASGVILESTSRQNTLRVLVESGDFDLGIDNSDLSLQSSTLSDDVGIGISSTRSLSENITINIFDYNFAILKTSENHNLSTGDIIDISINPDDSVTEKTYYVRKKLFQEIQLRDRRLVASLQDNGIGGLSILTGGLYSAPGTYSANLGNASVDVVITNYGTYNSVSEVIVTDKGSNFREDEILTLDNLVGVTEDRPAIFRVDHAGLGPDETTFKLTSVEYVSVDDLLTIDDEIVKVVSIDNAERLVGIERGQQGTVAAKHFNTAIVEFSNPIYRFTPGQYLEQIGTSSTDPTVYSYNPETNLLILQYEYGIDITQTPNISLSSFFSDSSSPEKNVSIQSVGKKTFKLEFSEDDENNFIINPNIDIQLYYKYIFDTSHPSMVNTYLDFSPSLNYNLITLEKVVGGDEPGSGLPNSFVSLKFGFGLNTPDNTFTNTQSLRFTNYYYFIVASGVDTDNSRVSVGLDPLVGTKVIDFTVDNKFTYSILKQPQENGSGSISYVTNSENSIGEIKSIKVENSGSEYTDIPTILGIIVPESEEAKFNVILDELGNITTVSLIDGGKNYTSPVIITESEEGTPGVYRPSVVDGKIAAVNVLEPGTGYSKPPTLRAIETAHRIYATSDNIGLPKSVIINNPGANYTKDTTTLPKFTSTLVVLLSNVSESRFPAGKKVRQFGPGGIPFFEGTVVTSVRKNSNIVKFKNIVGELDQTIELEGASIVAILSTDYETEFKSFFDKKGFFNSEKGIISATDSKITDSYYYQDYSYVIRSYSPIDIWRDLIKDVVHPAGFQLFGEVVVENEVKAVAPPEEQPIIPFLAQINVSVEGGFSESSIIQLTEVVSSFGDINITKGVGRLALDEENLSTTNIYDISLSPEFDGYIDGDTGLTFGTRTFTMRDAATGALIEPYNENALIISINGVVQEPKVAFTVSGSEITFATAPLGPRVSEGQSLDPADFIGRLFEFVDTDISESSFKKAKNIFQRSGIWLDSANQIRFNRNFIVEETFGYITTKYPATQFDTGKCKRDIGLIIDAFEHDLRFGGNLSTVTAGNSYYNAAQELDFINNELEETREAYLYAAKLCAAAIRNWDVAFIDDPSTADPIFEVIVTANSDLITVPSTFGIVEGMYLSSGSQFPLDTRVIEIIDETNIRVSNNSFADISDTSSFIFEVPSSTIEELPGTSGEIEFEYNGIQINTDAQLIIDDGTTVSITAAIARLRQVRFSLSRINTGTFVDAANLIKVNRSYIIDETISYINSTFPGFVNPSEVKCRRDTGYLIDAVVYHLQYGGNNRIIDYAEKYYLANKLNYINDELTETVAAFTYAVDLMQQAILDPGAPFETTPYAVAPDESFGVQCAEVQSAIESYKDSYIFILENGPNLIQRDFGNQQRSGEYTTLKTYSNYDLIDDVELQLSTEIDGVVFGAECAEVISAVYTLHQSLDTILTTGAGTVESSRPDYIDGENTLFELYKDNGDVFKTNNGEDLLVFINGILQKPPAYKIIRSENPDLTDLIEFSAAPKWDQSDAQLRLGEGLSIETFHAYSIGSYERRRVNSSDIPIRKDLTIFNDFGAVTAVTDPRYYTIFVDGVQQRPDVDYTISGNRLVFKKRLNNYTSPDGITTIPNVDIISYQGGSDNNTFTAFYFERNGAYSALAILDLYYSADGENFYETVKDWDAPSRTHPIQIYNDNNPIGSVYDYEEIQDPYPGIRLKLAINNNPEINSEEPIIFRKRLENVPDLDFTVAITFDENITFLGPDFYVFGNITVAEGTEVVVDDTATVVSAEIVFNFEEEDGQRLLRRTVTPWLFAKEAGNKAWRGTHTSTAKILEGDKIKVNGESNFRTITSVPDIVKTNNYNTFTPNTFYGSITTSPSLERPSGSGLSITTIIDPVTGSITGLDYGEPDLIRLRLLGEVIPQIGTGYQEGVYIDFIPVDGNGGGGFARVLTWDGIVVGLQIENPGYGYTSPPAAIVTRGYDIIKTQRNIQTSLSRNINISLFPSPLVIGTQAEIIVPNLTETGSYIPVGFADPIDEFIINKFLEAEVASAQIPTGLTQEILRTSGANFNSRISLVPSAQVGERLFVKPQESSAPVGASTATTGSVLILSESRVGAGDTLITPESLNQLAALVNIQFNLGDTTLFVTSTNGFPDSGLLIIGTEVVTYSSKLPDRFFIDLRGAEGTTEAVHPIGEVVKVYLNFINGNGPPEQEIEAFNEDAIAGPVSGTTDIILRFNRDLDVTSIDGFSDPAAPADRAGRTVESLTTDTLELTATTDVTKRLRSTTVEFVDVPEISTNVTLLNEVDAPTYDLVSTSQIDNIILPDSNLVELSDVNYDINISLNTISVSPVPSGTTNSRIIAEIPPTPEDVTILDVTLLKTNVEELVIGFEFESTAVELTPTAGELVLLGESLTSVPLVTSTSTSEFIAQIEEVSIPEDTSYIFIGETVTVSEQITLQPRETEVTYPVISSIEEIESDVQTLVTAPGINSVSISSVENNDTEESEIIIPVETIDTGDTLVSVSVSNSVSESLTIVSPSVEFAGSQLGRTQELRKQPEDIVGTYPAITTEEEITSEYSAAEHKVITPSGPQIVDVDTIIDNGAIDVFNETINPSNIGINP